MTPETVMSICRQAANSLARHAGRSPDLAIDVDDLAQEGAAKVVKRGLLETEAPPALVFTVARNAMVDHLRTTAFGYARRRGEPVTRLGTIGLESDCVVDISVAYDPTGDWDAEITSATLIKDLTVEERRLLATLFDPRGGIPALARELGVSRFWLWQRRRDLLRRLRRAA